MKRTACVSPAWVCMMAVLQVQAAAAAGRQAVRLKRGLTEGHVEYADLQVASSLFQVFVVV